MLDVEVRKKRGAEVIVLAGELDCAEELICRQALDSVPADPRRKLVFDLSGVTFMDSTGIKLFLHADHSARVQGLRRPLIKGASPQVMRVLDAAGVTAMLNVEPKEKDGRPDFRSWSAEHPSRWGRQIATD